MTDQPPAPAEAADELRQRLARTLASADNMPWLFSSDTGHHLDRVREKYLARADELLFDVAVEYVRIWDEGYNQAVRDHKMRRDGEGYCEWPTTLNPYRPVLDEEGP